MGKTPEYVKKAVNNYRKDYDFIQVRFDKKLDIRQRLADKGSIAEYISKLVLSDLEKTENNGVNSFLPDEIIERVKLFDDCVNDYIIQAVVERLEADEELALELAQEEESKEKEAEELAEAQAFLEERRAEEQRKKEERKSKEVQKKQEEPPKPPIYFDANGKEIKDPDAYLLALKKKELEEHQKAVDLAHGNAPKTEDTKAIETVK